MTKLNTLLPLFKTTDIFKFVENMWDNPSSQHTKKYNVVFFMTFKYKNVTVNINFNVRCFNECEKNWEKNWGTVI